MDRCDDDTDGLHFCDGSPRQTGSGQPVFARAEWLGQDFAFPLHRMHNGALLLFDFFAVSDRMTHMNAGCAGLTYAERGALSA
jgi:hypothetical protein